MAGIASLLDLWKKNQSFNTAKTYQSSSFFSASASAASFAAGASFAPRNLFRAPVGHCDAGAAVSEDYISTLKSPTGKYFYHDSLKYSSSTKQYTIELKPLSSAFELNTLVSITLRSFMLFYASPLEYHAYLQQDEDDYPVFHRKNTDWTDSFKKSVIQIFREITVLTTKRILERITVRHVSNKRAWRLLKDVPESAARKAERRMSSLVYFSSVSRATFRGNLLGVSASWLVQVGIRIYQFLTIQRAFASGFPMNREDRLRILKVKIIKATIRCSSSLIFASIGAAIGATLFNPSAGQCIGGAVGDLGGPVIVGAFMEMTGLEIF